MGELNFQTSRRTYTVNGGAEISFDPADISFANRMYNLVNKLGEMQQESTPEDSVDIFAVAAVRDADMRAEIDAAFGESVCDKVFGSTNVFSPAGGLPLCLNFLLAVIDEIDAASARELKTSPQVAAYMQKYEAKYGKYMKK